MKRGVERRRVPARLRMKQSRCSTRVIERRVQQYAEPGHIDITYCAPPLLFGLGVDPGLALARGPRGTRVSAVAVGLNASRARAGARGGAGGLAFARVAGRCRSGVGGARPVSVAARRTGRRARADRLPRRRRDRARADRRRRRPTVARGRRVRRATSPPRRRCLSLARTGRSSWPRSSARSLHRAQGPLFAAWSACGPHLRRRQHVGPCVAGLAGPARLPVDLRRLPGVDHSRADAVRSRRGHSRPCTSRLGLRCLSSRLSASLPCGAGRRAWSSRLFVRRRFSRPRSGFGWAVVGSAPSPRRHSSPGWPEGSRCSSRPSPTRRCDDPFSSFKLLVAVLLGGAAATLGPAVGVAALGLIALASGPLARALQLPLEALRCRRRRAAARLRARSRRCRDRRPG